ncbi:MAG: hypothetical protein Fur0032_09320 [Terrimicrobiaceae bacterium]
MDESFVVDFFEGCGGLAKVFPSHFRGLAGQLGSFGIPSNQLPKALELPASQRADSRQLELPHLRSGRQNGGMK